MATEDNVNNTTSDPNESNVPGHARGSSLDWKFGQRSSIQDLQIRGIIPEQYADVAHGDKSLDEAKREWDQYRRNSSKQIKKKLDLKLRPSPQDLKDRGIVPDWENPNILNENKQKNKAALKMKLRQRMDPDEADQRAIINKDELFSNQDYHEHRKHRRLASKKLKLKMENSLSQRADKTEIIFRGIVPQEYLEDDPNVAKSKIRQQRSSIKQQMNQAFGNRPSQQEMSKLLAETADNASDEEAIGDETESSLAPSLNWKFGQRSSIKELQIRGIVPEQYADVAHGDKSLEEAKREYDQYKKDSSKQIKKKLDSKLRPTPKDLQDRGIVPDWDNPNILTENKQKNKAALKMKLRQRMDPDEADQRAIINKNELFSNKDYDEHKKDKKLASKQLKLKMESSLVQRADKDEIVFRGIVPQEYLEEDANVAKSKLKQQKTSIKQKMDQAFGNRPTQQEMSKILQSSTAEEWKQNMLDVFSNKSMTEEKLIAFFKEKPDIAQLVTKGLVSAQYIGKDSLKNGGQSTNGYIQNNERNMEEEYNKKEISFKSEIYTLQQRIGRLEEEISNLKENENKYKKEVEEVANSKYKLIKSTSEEIDALRYKIKMYTQGNWNGVVSNSNK